MKSELEKIDELRERVDLTYEEARTYLEAAKGDLVDALIMAERDLILAEAVDDEGFDLMDEEGDGGIRRVMDKVRHYVKRGAKARLVVERDGNVLANIPVAAGIVGAWWAPQVAALGAITALATGCAVRIHEPETGMGESSHIQ